MRMPFSPSFSFLLCSAFSRHACHAMPAAAVFRLLSLSFSFFSSASSSPRIRLDQSDHSLPFLPIDHHGWMMLPRCCHVCACCKHNTSPICMQAISSLNTSLNIINRINGHVFAQHTQHHHRNGMPGIKGIKACACYACCSQQGVAAMCLHAQRLLLLPKACCVCVQYVQACN